MSFKKDFLEYVLYSYEFKENDPVHVLNYLKSIKHFDSRVSLINRHSPISLKISTKGEHSQSMMCHIDDKILLTARDTIDKIDHTEHPIFIEFHFDQFEPKYAEVVFREHERLQHVKQELRHSLYQQIEQALESKDKDTFLSLTNELKLLNEESKNALHKK